MGEFNMDYQMGQINQLKAEKYHLKLMVQRRNREINDHMKNLYDYIKRYGDKEAQAWLSDELGDVGAKPPTHKKKEAS